MKDFWLFPILDNMKYFEFTKSQQKILKLLLDELGFILYSPTITDDWYVFDDKNSDSYIELFFHKNCIHICAWDRYSNQIAEQLVQLCLQKCLFLRLGNDSEK
ncbi:MAG: hypothetical protein Q3971_06305 [Moraxella sp.]|nr:hypothetical protein [Moraxella sp.]